MKEIKVICFGEILWDNLLNGRRLGGAPLNVCYHLSKMGVEAQIISQIGDDDDGVAILESLKTLGIHTDAIQISDSRPTSTVEVHLQPDNEVSYDIVEDVAWDHISYSNFLGQLVRSSEVLVFGSLAARSSLTRGTLLRLVEQSDFRVFDVNLRPPFYDQKRIFSLLKLTHLLKLNMAELDEITNWIQEGLVSQNQKIETLRNEFPNIKEILLTQGHEGAVYIKGNSRIEIPALKVEVKDTVGSGDSFLAAFLAARLNQEPVYNALVKASVLSGYVATRNGACPVYSQQDLEVFKQTYNQQN